MIKKSIQERLDEVQKGCRERIVTEDDILKAIKYAEDKLTSLNIAKKYWVESFIEIIQGELPNRYHYAAYGTYVKIVRFKTKWEVFIINRELVKTRSGGGWKKCLLTLSKTAIDSMNHVYYIGG